MNPNLLTANERTTLAAICQTLFPPLTAETGDDAELFALNAQSLGVAAALEGKLALLPPDLQRSFRLVLRALDSSIAMAPLAGRFAPFSALDHTHRERALLAMANSRVEQLRTAFQALKRLGGILFYDLMPDGRINPTWGRIGYVPSPLAPAIAAPLRLTHISADTTLDADVCVIGSGAGGGVAAAVLAARGKRVIVLEAGSGRQAPDFDQRELTAVDEMFLCHGLSATSDFGIAVLAGAVVGGGTVVNWQTSLPLPDEIRNEWTRASGCGHFEGPSFAESLQFVSERTSTGTAESVVNANNAVLRKGCEALGFHWVELPRNSSGCSLSQCGYCVYGCRHGGKQSTASTFLVDAQGLGNTEIIARCRAERVRMAGGRVSGVDAVVIDRATGHRWTLRVNAPLVVMAAGGIGSPIVLQRSGIESPALGRHLSLHPAVPVAAAYAEPIEPARGAPQTIMCDEFSPPGELYGFRIEAAPAHPGLLGLALPWLGARAHRRLMQQYAHYSTTITLVRDRTTGRVTAGHDGWPVIEYHPGPHELRQLGRGIAESVRIHLAAGAERVITLHQKDHSVRRSAVGTREALDRCCEQIAHAALDRNWATLFTAHQMGTCRMGTDRRAAVCDPDGAVYGVKGLSVADASAFPLSSGVNPMITVMAVAHHNAQRIA